MKSKVYVSPGAVVKTHYKGKVILTTGHVPNGSEMERTYQETYGKTPVTAEKKEDKVKSTWTPKKDKKKEDSEDDDSEPESTDFPPMRGVFSGSKKAKKST